MPLTTVGGRSDRLAEEATQLNDRDDETPAESDRRDLATARGVVRGLPAEAEDMHSGERHGNDVPSPPVVIDRQFFRHHLLVVCRSRRGGRGAKVLLALRER